MNPGITYPESHIISTTLTIPGTSASADQVTFPLSGMHPATAFSTIVIAQMSYVHSFGSSGKYLIPLLSPEWSFTLLAQFWSYVLHIFTSCEDHYRIKSCSTFFSPVFTDATNLYPITVHFQFRITFWTFFQYIHSYTLLC